MEVFVVPLQDRDVKEITGRMDVMIKLMAALFAREFSNIDAIVKLENMQLSREQIASALGITKENVRQQLYMASKKVEKKPKKSEGQAVAAEPSTEVLSSAAEEA
jgi:DNA-directed RNA polymerase specialized sigma24 family protein